MNEATLSLCVCCNTVTCLLLWRYSSEWHSTNDGVEQLKTQWFPNWLCLGQHTVVHEFPVLIDELQDKGIEFRVGEEAGRLEVEAAYFWLGVKFLYRHVGFTVASLSYTVGC